MAAVSQTRFLLAKRTAMVAATAFLAINLWTGAPLIALWVGSQLVRRSTLSMGAVIVVVVVLAVLVFSMSIALTWLSREYDRLSGREPGERRKRRDGAEQDVHRVRGRNPERGGG